MRILSVVLFCLLFSSNLFAQEEFVAKVITPTSTGSCVIISKLYEIEEGWLGYGATAYHVISDVDINNSELLEKSRPLPTFKIEYQNGRTCSTASVVEYDKKNDLAIIQTWIPKDMPTCKLWDETTDGEVTIAGYPFGELSTKKGKYLRSIKTSHYCDIMVNPGYSGGGLFRGKDLIGIIQGGWLWEKDENNKSSTWPTKTCSQDPINILLNKINSRK